jgi:hypothetical protein
MCRQVIESLFHNCGHIERVEIPSINLECFKETNVVLYHGEEFCRRCIWGRFGPEYRAPTTLSLRGRYRQGRVKTIVKQNADHWKATAKDALWARRDEFVEKLNTWQGETLGENFHERYVNSREDEILRGVPIQHRLYYLGPGQVNRNFLKRIESEEVSNDRENCFCWFSTKVRGGRWL